MSRAKNTIGVYSLTFPNGDVYIGSSVMCETRLAKHLSDLRRGMHRNGHVQHVCDKYGAPKFQILEVCDDPEILTMREQAWIDARGLDELLNFGPALPSPFFGRTHSPETLQKMSKAQKGNQNGLGSQNFLGHKHTSETRLKMSEAHKGNKSALGYKHTPEIRQKISEANKGRVLTPEHRQRISEANRARVITPETIQKLSDAGKLRTHSPETRQKMSEARKRYLAAKLDVG